MRSGSLANKTIVVIGGTSGLGFSAAKAFVAAGAQVVIVGRDKDKTESAIHAGVPIALG